MSDVFQRLQTAIRHYNTLYENLLATIRNAELENDDERVTQLQKQKWQLIHDYATEISDMVIFNVEILTKEDLTSLDMVPYIVWMKVKAHTITIVNQLYKGEAT